jgi:hypothetical protein
MMRRTSSSLLTARLQPAAVVGRARGKDKGEDEGEAGHDPNINLAQAPGIPNEFQRKRPA